MLKLVSSLSIIGIIFLAAATITLVAFNYNQDVKAKAVSGVLLGLATIFISVFFSLKETKNEQVFTFAIAVDEGFGQPAHFMPDSTGARRNLWPSSIYHMTMPIGGDPPQLLVKKPKDQEETIAFLMELMQYKILKDILQAQNYEAFVLTVGPNVSTSIHPIVKTSDLRTLSKNEITRVLGANQFAQGNYEDFIWSHTKFSLPKNTKLNVAPIEGPEKIGAEKRLLTFKKANYFQTDFIVECFNVSNLGIIPEGAKSVNAAQLSRCRTYHFAVKMNAKFERISSGNPKSKEYQEWVSWIFDEIKNANRE